MTEQQFRALYMLGVLILAVLFALLMDDTHSFGYRWSFGFTAAAVMGLAIWKVTR